MDEQQFHCNNNNKGQSRFALLMTSLGVDLLATYNANFDWVLVFRSSKFGHFGHGQGPTSNATNNVLEATRVSLLNGFSRVHKRRTD